MSGWHRQNRQNLLDEWQPFLCNALVLKLMRPTIVAFVGGLALCATSQASLFQLSSNYVGQGLSTATPTSTSQQIVSGLPSVIQNVNVEVTISGGYNGTLYGY
jgi:hypothetical protein